MSKSHWCKRFVSVLGVALVAAIALLVTPLPWYGRLLLGAGVASTVGVRLILDVRTIRRYKANSEDIRTRAR